MELESNPLAYLILYRLFIALLTLCTQLSCQSGREVLLKGKVRDLSRLATTH